MSRTEQQGYSDKTENGQQQVQELKAGRDLDALIAQRVFGLVQCQSDAHANGSDWPNTYCFAQPDSPTQGGDVHAYSTDIAAAWEVHRKMCDHLFSVRQIYLRAIQDETRQHSPDGILIAWPDVLVVLRDRFPEAICVAALEAVSV